MILAFFHDLQTSPQSLRICWNLGNLHPSDDHFNVEIDSQPWEYGASSMVTRSIAGRITQALLSNDERAEARSSDWLTLGRREIFESLRGENCPHLGNRTERKEAGPSCTILDPQVKLYQTYRLVHSYHSLLHYHPNTFGSGGFGHERWCFLPWLISRQWTV